MPDPGISLGVIVAANAVMAIASLLQASVGIGLALLAVPLLALIEPGFIPGPMLLSGSLLALSTAYRERHALEPASFTMSLVGLLAGTIVGALILGAISAEHLSKVFATLILLAVGLSLSGLRVRATRMTLLAGGGAAGVMGTIVGIHGPPIALVFQNSGPERARAMLGAFFFVAYLGSVVALSIFGLFGETQLVLSAELLPGVFCGLLAAPFGMEFFNAARLRVAILGISATSAVMLLFR
ncbi:MAG: TSUP family transporter [Desulfobacteraceae bacterium]|nr:TSUP family transporter [Desulfobacteraceae bacterium]